MANKLMRATKLKIFLLAALLLAASTFPAVSTGAAGVPGGLDLAGMDKSVNPGDDFFSYANGNWMKSVKIPEDRSSYGVFDMLAEEANQRTADIIKDASKSAGDADARKIGDY